MKILLVKLSALAAALSLTASFFGTVRVDTSHVRMPMPPVAAYLAHHPAPSVTPSQHG